MQTKDTHSEIIKMQTHNRMSYRTDVLVEQSLQLMEIVNKNQTEVNRLKAKQEKLKVGV